MKKKNGFTLVELIAVIAILVVILAMFVPTLLNSINENKTKALNKIYDLIETAARNYVMDYNISTPTKIELEDLCNTTYIECPIINPETEEELNGYIFVGEDYYYSEVTETNVTVELNGGDTSQTFENSYEPGTVIDLITPTKGEEEFKGWRVVKGNSGIRDNKLIIGTTETIVWAEWKTKELVKLTVDLDGGSLSDKPETAYLPGAIITLESPTKEGYTFAGWTTDNGIISGNTFTMGSKETTITAIWEVNTYIVTLNANGGTLENTSIEVTYGNEYGTLPIPVKEGYVFAGWYTELDGYIKVGNTTIVSKPENHELYASWLYSEFAYTGGEQEFIVPISGYYQLEVWGAQGGVVTGGNGGTISTLTPGYGGYSTGVVYLEEGERLYINVGGKGADNCLSSANGTVNLCNGGYNGGGTGYSSDCYKYVSGGGGATHIAKSAGELSTFTEETIKEVLIVAGGGGGSAYFNWESAGTKGYGGSGGGVKGNDGNINKQTTSGANGGTQTTGYLIGQGETPATSTDNNSRAGGGGGYYGGLSGTTKSIGAGGGSGYIGNVLLTNKVMYCYNCTESGDESTKTISTTNVSEDAISNYAKKGNGYAKITYIGETNDLN